MTLWDPSLSLMLGTDILTTSVNTLLLFHYQITQLPQWLKPFLSSGFVDFNYPTIIHSDRAPEFVGHLLSHLWEMLGIHRTRALPYWPQSDGLVERFNSTIKSMLKCAVGWDKYNWGTYLPALLLVYNATEQASTRCTPNLLFLGEELTLPVDVMFGTKKDNRPWIRPYGSICYYEYVETKRNWLVAAFSAARSVVTRAATRQERGYNIHLKPSKFTCGEMV